MKALDGEHGRALRSRATYVLCGALVIVLGLAWRSAWVGLPAFVAKYGGDALWALLVFLILGFLRPAWPTWRVAALAFGVSCAVELSQLYHAPWIDAIRHTTLGALVLGDAFAFGDLAAYVVGIASGTAAEGCFYRRLA
jgi:glycopeptide antibiotics resistance protein